jgi:hypothetical protein
MENKSFSPASADGKTIFLSCQRKRKSNFPLPPPHTENNLSAIALGIPSFSLRKRKGLT